MVLIYSKEGIYLEKENLNVLVVADVLGEENNGTTIAAMNLIRSLKKKGHDVKVLCCDKDKEGQEGYYVVPKKNFGIFNNYVQKNGVSIAKYNIKTAARALQGVDVVHSMLPFSLGKNIVKQAHKKNIPVTSGFHMQAENISAHLGVKNVKFINKFIYRYYNKRYYKHVNAIHYPTQFSREVFEKVVGKTPGYVISNGVNLVFSNKPDNYQRNSHYKDKFVILNTSRYSDEKCQKVLLRAVKKSKYSNNIQVILAGSGPLEGKLRHIGRNLRYKPIMKFFTRKEMINNIFSADLYVHPADIEIESIACLEAIAGGLVPVISNSKRSAARHFALTEKNLFENNNVKSLVKQIDYWIENPHLKEENQKLYNGFIDKFDFDYCMDQMENMLYETIEKYHLEK